MNEKDNFTGMEEREMKLISKVVTSAVYFGIAVSFFIVAIE